MLIVSDDITFSDRLFQSSITLCENKTQCVLKVHSELVCKQILAMTSSSLVVLCME